MNNNKKIFHIGGILFWAFLPAMSVMAQEYFHMDLLRKGGGVPESQGLYGEDYLAFVNQSSVPPGPYYVDIQVNKELVSNQEVNFVLKGTGQEQVLYPCFDKNKLLDLGIQVNGAASFASNGDSCIAIDTVQSMHYEMDWQGRVLSLAVPQLNIDKDRLWSARQSLWDEGINHAFVNYNFFSYKREGERERRYLNLRSGFNAGAWRYRNYSTWRDGPGSGSSWNNITNTLSRNIIALESELTVGDANTNSRVFTGFRFRGINLRSSEQMRPNWENSYVPTISGIASADSLLTISQGDTVIYRNNIPAGPYSINDYYPASYGGQLEVRLEGVDGGVTDFVVPFASIPILERQGRLKYDFSAGRYRSEDWAGEMNKNTAQLDLSYGLTDFTTVYGGAQASSDYQAYAFGIGQNMGDFGALAADIQHIRYQRQELTESRHYSSRAIQANYAKGIAQTGTSFVLDWRQALDNKYVTLSDAMSGRYALDRQKSHLGASLNQALPGKWGTLSGGAYQVKYQSGTKVNAYNLGYNNFYRGITYSLHWQRNSNRHRSVYTDDYNYNTNQVMFTVSIPLFVSDRSVWASYSINRDNERNVRQNVSLSGTELDSRLNWGVDQGYGNHGYSYTGGARASYSGGAGTVSAGYSYVRKERASTMNYGVVGALTLSEYGLVASPELTEANALIYAPQADGIELINGRNVKTNRSGLAVLPGLGAYRDNRIALDVNTIPDDVDMESTMNVSLYPTKGAMVLSRFETQRGYKAVFVIKNRRLPVGAQAYIQNTEQKEPILVAGYNQLFTVVPEPQGVMRIQWNGDAPMQTCLFEYDLESLQSVSGYYYTEVACLKEGEQHDAHH